VVAVLTGHPLIAVRSIVVAVALAACSVRRA
jgi:hypothetical protein